MRLTTVLTGSNLLMHNIQLADPDNVWTKRISAVTAKRKKTEDDRRELARLEWFGSLYTHDGKVVIPTTNVRKCFSECAKITKMGKTINRALAPLELVVPLVFNGPQDPEQLWHSEEFRDTTLVGVRGQRVVRTRPIFRAWMLSIEWELLTEVCDLDEFIVIVKRAGQVEGLGDNRGNGYGRFAAEVKAAKQPLRSVG